MIRTGTLESAQANRRHLKLANGTIAGSRFVVNAVAAHPMRLKSVEDAVAGKPRNEETAMMAGALAVQGARPLAVQAEVLRA